MDPDRRVDRISDRSNIAFGPFLSDGGGAILSERLWQSISGLGRASEGLRGRSRARVPKVWSHFSGHNQ